MNNHIKKLARKNIRSLKPYQSARRIGGNGNIWLNANEYPLSVPFNLSQKDLNRYPECQPKELIERYAFYSGVKPEQILVSRGADEGIELIMRTFCEPGQDKILCCSPTYGMYTVVAETIGIKYRTIPMKINNWQPNLSIISNQLDTIKVIYICNPNNPTGNLVNINILHRILEMSEKKILVVIDEAYIEFCPHATSSNWLKNYKHLIILRTLSKAFALAGLRCGFTLANKEIINLLLKVITPYPLAKPIIDIAIQSLSKERIELMNTQVSYLNKNKKWLEKNLKKCRCVETIFPSNTNYLLIRFKNSKIVFKTLSDKGIIVRDQSENLNLKRCLRISIGTQKESEELISVLQNIYME